MLTETERMLMEKLTKMDREVRLMRKHHASTVDGIIAGLNMIDNTSNGQIIKSYPEIYTVREDLKQLSEDLRDFDE